MRGAAALQVLSWLGMAEQPPEAHHLLAASLWCLARIEGHRWAPGGATFAVLPMQLEQKKHRQYGSYELVCMYEKCL